MVNSLSFAVQERKKTGKGYSRLLRTKGLIPAVVYGNKLQPKNIYLEKKYFVKHLGDSALFNEIYSLDINGNVVDVLVREVQFDPIKSNDPIHVNFLRIGKDSVVTIEVPVIFTNQNKCPGLKFGGVLNVIAHTLEVRCNPKDAPKSIEIDLSSARIGTVIKIEDIMLPKGVKVYYSSGYAIASITTPDNEEKQASISVDTSKA